MARVCGKCSAAAAAKAAALKAAQQTKQGKYLVTCTNCESALLDSHGMFIPVHVLPVSVDRSSVDLWVSQGYTLEVIEL